MKKDFNHQVVGVPPEQTRAAFSQPNREKSMVEQEKIVPVLKPLGMGEDVVGRQHFRERLKQERQRVQQYQMRVTEIHTCTHINGKLLEDKVEREVAPINRTHHTSHEFNMQAAFEHDAKELELSF